MSIHRKIKQITTTLLTAFFMVFALGAQGLAAPTYGCGTYGSGGYGANCPTTSSSSSSSSSSGTTTVEEGEKIVLNEFDEYLTSVGKDLDLDLNDQVFFNVEVLGVAEEHTATIKEVGTDYVIITFASTPEDVRINLGQTITHDVTGDDEPDIEVKLNSITAGAANLTFRQYIADAEPIQEKTTTTTTEDAEDEGSSFPGWVIVVIAVLAAVGILWFLMARHDNNQLTPGPQ